MGVVACYSRLISVAFITVQILNVAAWMYFVSFPNDRWIFKLLVSTCFILCLADTAGTGEPHYRCSQMYSFILLRYLGLRLGSRRLCEYVNVSKLSKNLKSILDPGIMGFTHWALPAEAMFLCEPFSSTVPPLCDWLTATFCSGTAGTLVQCFYAWRVWLVSTRKNWIVPIIIVCLSLVGWCTCIWYLFRDLEFHPNQASFAGYYLWSQPTSWFPNYHSSRVCSYNVLISFTQFLSSPNVYIWLGGSV
jgi:hypothetical protein